MPTPPALSPTASSRSTRKSRRNTPCDECKRRKIRCSAEPRCKTCARDSKTCTYSTPQHRVTFLERENEHYETLFASLRQTWARHLPDVPLDKALLADTPAAVGGSPRATSKQSASASSVQHSASWSTGQHNGPSLSLTSPDQNNAEDYEFDESHDASKSIDGMGFLTNSPGRSGYTGPHSGISAMRFLRSLPFDRGLGVANDGLETDFLQPTQASLPSSGRSDEGDVESALNHYFRYYHTAYPLLHEGMFRARHFGAVPKPRDGSWPLLYNMVLAMGSFVGADDSSNTDLSYYHIARQSLSLSVLGKGSLGYVQGLMIMSNYLQKRNKPNEGFAMIGLAWSMALAIGLHRDFGDTSTSPFTIELRRRTWWTLFVFVSGAQLTFGRPPASLIGVNVNFPTNVKDGDLAVDIDVPPLEYNEPTVASSLIAQVKLAILSNAVQTELLNHSVPEIDKTSALNESINVWYSQLPSYFDIDLDSPSWFLQPRMILIWRSYQLRIVLNRPFLFEAVSRDAILTFPDMNPITECVETANTCVRSICHFVECRQPCLRGLAWYATYWLISASFVHVTCLTYVPSHACAEEWRSYLDRAVKVLEILGVSHEMASRARNVLLKVLRRYETFNASAGCSQSLQALLDVSTLDLPVDYQDRGQLGPYIAGSDSFQFDDTTDLSWLWAQGVSSETFNDYNVTT